MSAVDDADLPLSTPLPAQADPTMDRIAEVVRSVIGVPVALVSLVDASRQVFPGAAGLGPPWSESRETPLSHSFCQHVVRTRTPLVISDAREHPVLRENLAIRDLDVVAYAGVPLVDLDGNAVGSLCAIDTEPRQWTVAELGLLDDLASACSTELQLRAALERSATAYRRTEALLDLSEAMSGAITATDVAATVAAAAHELLGATFGGITEIDGSGRELRYVQQSASPNVPITVGPLLVDSDTPSSRVVHSGQPLIVALDELESISPSAASLGREAGGGTFAYYPLRSRGRTLGSLSLMWQGEHVLSADDRDVVAGLARYAAQALDRAQLLAEQHEVARTLQSALLPGIPDIPWLELAGRYLPAYRGNEVGGDWYDAHVVSDDRVIVTVGDVSGHDTEAAAAMGQLRAASRTIMVTSPGDTADLLTCVDAVMASLGFERVATALAACITRSGDVWSVRWSNAGHPPPLVLAPGEEPYYLDEPADPLLGLGQPAARVEHARPLAAGTTLVLFTDGLIERRGVHLDDGLAWLAALAGAHRDRPVADLVATLIEAAPHREQFDDTVVLGVRLPASTS